MQSKYVALRINSAIKKNKIHTSTEKEQAGCVGYSEVKERYKANSV